MADQQTPKPPQNLPSSSSTSSHKVSGEIGQSGQRPHYPNPPDARNPDPATLREQWKYAIRQYSRWYSQAWGTAILAGVSFFALGWIIKGSNPLPSFQKQEDHNPSPPPPPPPPPSAAAADDVNPAR